LRLDHEQDATNIFKCIQYADAMRFFSLRYHDGGTYEIESIHLYDTCVALVVDARNRARAAGRATNVNKAVATTTTTTTTTSSSSLYSLSINGDGDDDGDYNDAFSNDLIQVADEATLDYTEKSLDGMLCAVYTAQGKNYFLANLFARAAEAYSHCLDEIEPNYLDARNNRASALIVLGDYEQAAADLTLVIQRDRHRIFTDAFMGLARILETKEEAVVGGWDNVVRLLEGELIPQFQVQWSSVASVSTSLLSLEQQQVKQVFGTALRRFHHVLFTYHDRKTKNYPEAWKHLTKSHSYKLSVLTPWVRGSEMVKLNQIQQVFKPGFWPPEVGSDLQTPIFVVGFPRSGSTLLESVLDAHPQIVGTGENSVFNGRLDDIRNQIVRVSMTGQRDQIGPLTRTLAQEVVDEMQRLWEMRVQKTKREKSLSSSNVSSTKEQQGEQVDEEKPRRFVDKMLTNYFNIGFIHMLYPKALILHVVREPMDTIFSAYKHEFPAGGLEYTSDMHALSELYLSYRQVMEHWDAVLPGRVTHIRYEDLVHDMPGMARALIAATGLQWDDAVLNKRQDYHVNTMSATQIRKKVYKDSVKSWMRYQNELKDLIQLIGDRVDCDIQTTLPNYSRAPPAV
jgi:Sulfotransferase family